jgi:hypothetical protein
MVAVLTLTTAIGVAASTASPAAAASWHDWQDIGTPPADVAYEAPAATARPSGETDLAVASWGYVYTRTLSKSGVWSGWGDRGRPNGQSAVSVAIAARTTGQLYVFAATRDGVVWQRTWTASTSWQPWQRVSVAPYGFVSTISAAVRSDGHVDLVGRGSDGSVYMRSQATHGGGWTAWQNMGTPAGGIYGAPAVASGPGVDIVVSHDASNHVYRKFWRPSTGWTGWRDEGRPWDDDNFQTFGVATTWKPDGSAFDIYAVDESGQLNRKAWGGGYFRDWEHLGWSSGTRPTAPAAAWGYTGRLDLFMRTPYGGNVSWKYWG